MAKKKKAASDDVLVVKSKVKEYIKGKDCNTASDLYDALSEEVKALLDKAVDRTKANGRKTVQSKDI